MEVQPSSSLAVDEDDLEAHFGVGLAVPRILSVELGAQEGLLLSIVPVVDEGELLRPRAGVDAVEELSVARLDRA